MQSSSSDAKHTHTSIESFVLITANGPHASKMSVENEGCTSCRGKLYIFISEIVQCMSETDMNNTVAIYQRRKSR